MTEASMPFTPPSAIERLFNKAFGVLAGFGCGPAYVYRLEGRGRTSRRRYATAVNVLAVNGKRFLVAPRGQTQWVRNIQAGEPITLRRGRQLEQPRLRALADAEKPLVLKAYLDRYRWAVQRYFPIPAGSPADAFVPVTQRYPVFEILPDQPRQFR